MPEKSEQHFVVFKLLVCGQLSYAQQSRFCRLLGQMIIFKYFQAFPGRLVESRVESGRPNAECGSRLDSKLNLSARSSVARNILAESSFKTLQPGLTAVGWLTRDRTLSFFTRRTGHRDLEWLGQVLASERFQF